MEGALLTAMRLKAKYSSRIYIESISMIAIFTALNIIITIFAVIKINNGQGYVNLSDVLIMTLSSTLHPVIGGLVGGISSCIADVSLGYGIYAPFSFIIKTLEGLLIGYLIRIVAKYNKKVALIVSPFIILIGGVFMSAGYFFLEYFLYGLSVASFDITFNLLQGLICSAISIVLFYSIYNMPIYNSLSVTANTHFLRK